MFKKIVHILKYTGLEREDYELIKDKMKAANHNALCMFTLISSIFLCGLYIVSFYNTVASVNRSLYFWNAVLMLILYLYAKYWKHKSLESVLRGVYCFWFLIETFGIALSMNHPNQNTTTFFVLLVLTPLMFYDRPYRVIQNSVIMTIVFYICVIHIKEDFALHSDLLNGIVFCLLSCVVNTGMLVIKIERLLYFKRAEWLSETDVLTGLRNRNCYEKNLPQTIGKAEMEVGVIYMDANGLHDLNNTKGHLAGDKLLCAISNRIKEYFGNKDCYRIGGDEFVILLFDQDAFEVEKKLRDMNSLLEKEDYHVSIGYSQMQKDEMPLNELIIKAEEIMYASKNAYYEGLRVRNKSY